MSHLNSQEKVIKHPLQICCYENLFEQAGSMVRSIQTLQRQNFNFDQFRPISKPVPAGRCRFTSLPHPPAVSQTNDQGSKNVALHCIMFNKFLRWICVFLWSVAENEVQNATFQTQEVS